MFCVIFSYIVSFFVKTFRSDDYDYFFTFQDDFEAFTDFDVMIDMRCFLLKALIVPFGSLCYTV